jgi:hypothetical protein
MKKALFLLLALVMVGSGFAQKAPQAKLISSSEDRIVVNFHLNGFSTEKVQTPQGEQYIVNVPRMASMLKAGAPDLPMFPIPAIIGDRAEMTVNVIDAQYTDYSMEIAPSKGNLSRQINPNDVPYTYGEMYQQDAFWPATQAYLEAPYILRDFRGQNIMVRPFAYNPVSKTLRVYTDMTIAMTKVSDNGVNPKVNRKSNTVKADIEILNAYENRFINFKDANAKYTFVVDQGSMLVVCVDEYMSAIQPLVDWKNMSGRPCTMVGSSTTGTDTQLKNYIQSYYAEHPDLTFILLVGEHSNLPGHSQNGGRSDIYYGMLEGSDLYAEALVGRFSPSNEADAAQQASRTIYYERDVDETAAWCNHGMGIGHTDGPGHYGETDWQHIDAIRDTLMHYTYTEVTQRYVNYNTVTNEIISQDINNGISIANYCNHGSATSWAATNYSTSHVNALVNDYMLPYVVSVACNNGQFDVGECFGESWMRSINESTGAPCGAIGGMFSWISQPWTPPMYGQDEINRILTEWIGDYKHTMGGVSINGSMFILDSSPEDSGNTYATWILFGDPSVMLRTDNPTDMNVSISPNVLMLGMNELTVNADAEFAIATLSMNGEVLATGYVENGQCQLTFPALTEVGSAQLVVLGYNKVTSITDLEVVPAEGAYITVNAFEMNAEQANYGETIDLNIDVKNVGVEIASNLSATLETGCNYVEVLSGNVSIAQVNPDEIITVNGFQFRVAGDVPDQTVAQFFLNVTDGTNEWQGKFNIMLHAPAITLSALEDNGQQITYTFTNEGSAPFYGGTLNVYSSSSDLNFDVPTITVEDVVEPDGSIALTMPYSFTENVEPGTTFEVAYEFISGMQLAEGIFIVTYGNITEDFESGLFGEGWTFSSQYPWTISGDGRTGNCAKSTNNGINNSEGYCELTVDILAAGDLTFWYKVSSENNYDKLHFFMDGQEKGVWSGEVDWSEFTQPVSVGSHTFKWSYSKDVSVNNGSDCAWIDDINFPPVNVVTFINSVTGLMASVNGSEVTLSWRPSPNAESYLVTRDGEEVTTVTEPIFTENVEDGVYVYSVFAQIGNEISQPATVVVNVSYDATGEKQEDLILVYPNPTNNVLNITAGNNFEYQLFNGMGQEVVNGKAQGIQQINVSNMAKGLYFLRITSGNQVNFQKVVVE